LERLIRAFVEAGCQTLEDARAIDVLRQHGGYSAIVADALRRELDRYTENPRAHLALNDMKQRIAAIVTELRAEVQTLLAHSGFEGCGKSSQVAKMSRSGSRSALDEGMYTEIDLVDKSRKWKGFADVILLTPEKCEIRDYKSGATKDADRFQVRVYAWLWRQDEERNPTGRLVNILSLVYPFGMVKVDAPTVEELAELEEELSTRAAQAFSDVSAVPPPARPGLETCRFCSVRQLCDDYWHSLPDIAARNERQATDLQLRVGARRGPRTWDAQVEVGGSEVAIGGVVIVDPKGQIGVLEDTTSVSIVTVGRNTEVFSIV
jgi:hypothetical protein